MACKLGVLADSSELLGNVIGLLKLTQNEIVTTALSHQVHAPLNTDLDAWVVSIEEHNDAAEALINWLEESDIPTIFADANRKGEQYTDEQARRFSLKLLDCLAQSKKAERQGYPSQIWLLAASAGGPEAVCEFLRTLPPMEDIAFFYIQHIDQSAMPSLVSALKQNSPMTVELCDSYKALQSGSIYVAMPNNEFDLTESGNIVEVDRAWKGKYLPSINQAVAKLASRRGTATGAIFFSGMGDDGIEAVGLLKAAGAPVWIQSPASCIVDSMPASIQTTVKVDFCGTPSELALNFAKMLKQAKTKFRLNEPVT